MELYWGIPFEMTGNFFSKALWAECKGSSVEMGAVLGFDCMVFAFYFKITYINVLLTTRQINYIVSHEMS
jgi:uncharacterized membrane protein (DUF485 family)